MAYNFIQWTQKDNTLVEGNNSTGLTLYKLTYSKADLDPCISEDTMNYHYGKLAKAYVDRYNSGEGDPDFNEAGAYLHNILFAQYMIPKSGNAPTGQSKEFIEEHYKDFNEFKAEFLKVAMGIQGSGWVYLAKGGSIKTIKNHQKKSDIILLIDWWEHAWALDYQSAKDTYLENQWKIIDWSVIDNRLQGA
jgi:Fe-Mn family superoxide dismutase